MYHLVSAWPKGKMMLHLMGLVTVICTIVAIPFVYFVYFAMALVLSILSPHTSDSSSQFVNAIGSYLLVYMPVSMAVISWLIGIATALWLRQWRWLPITLILPVLGTLIYASAGIAWLLDN